VFSRQKFKPEKSSLGAAIAQQHCRQTPRFDWGSRRLVDFGGKVNCWLMLKILLEQKLRRAIAHQHHCPDPNLVRSSNEAPSQRVAEEDNQQQRDRNRRYAGSLG